LFKAAFRGGFFIWRINVRERARGLLKSYGLSFGAHVMNLNPIAYTLPARHILSMMTATESDPPAGENDDDLDDELDETGAVTNRSNGKSGTNTEAEPDKK
jgi:hypothetical protein